MENEFDLLYACNHPGKPAFIVPLSEAFPVADIMEAENLGLIQRTPGRGRNFFSLTPAGKDRLLALYALREQRAYSAQLQQEQDAKYQAEKKEQALQAQADQKKQFRHDYAVALFSFALGVISTLFFDCFSEIVDFVQKLFAR